MKRPKTILCLILGGVLLLLFSYLFPIYTLKSFHSQTTASSKSWTAWPLGIKKNYEYRESVLESYLQQNYSEEIDHQWISSRGTGKNIYGQVVFRAHENPNQLLTYPREFLALWIENRPQEQIESFYLTLKNGTEEEIESAIYGLFKEVDILLEQKQQLEEAIRIMGDRLDSISAGQPVVRRAEPGTVVNASSAAASSSENHLHD